jgi:hypothetical protein
MRKFNDAGVFMDILKDTTFRNIVIYHVFCALRQEGIKYDKAIDAVGKRYHISGKTVERVVREQDGVNEYIA